MKARKATNVAELPRAYKPVMNVNELRDELATAFLELRSGQMKPVQAAELANLGGKMIASAKVQLEYFALLKETPRLPFLEAAGSRAGSP